MPQSINTLLKYTLVVCCCVSSPVFADNDYQITQKNNDASGYVNMLESFIEKASQRCTAFLQRDDDWRERLLEDWQQVNQEYTQAVRFWTDEYINTISLHYGESHAQYEQHKIESVVHMRGTNITNEIIQGDDQQKAVACEDFESRVVNGQLNVSIESPHYDHLQTMVELYR